VLGQTQEHEGSGPTTPSWAWRPLWVVADVRGSGGRPVHATGHRGG